MASLKGKRRLPVLRRDGFVRKFLLKEIRTGVALDIVLISTHDNAITHPRAR
jgi:hypothetical protein